MRSPFQDLEQLVAELRAEIVFSVSKTGGHLSASLGVVELAVALHHVFNTPEDKIIWDVGHQVHNQQNLTKYGSFLGLELILVVLFAGISTQNSHWKKV